MSTTVTLDGLNLNDWSLYYLMPGFNPGTSEPSYDEQVSYTGGIAITNVQPNHVVQLTLPIDVRAANESAMLAGVTAINTKIAACHFSTPKTLVVGTNSYQIIDSAQIAPVWDILYQGYVARLAIVLNRLP